MTPRQRAYALAAERGVEVSPRAIGTLLYEVALRSNDRPICSEFRRDTYDDKRLGMWGLVCGTMEPTAHLWRRVCAVLEAMPKGGESNE